ncbi:MAG: hypothetical protein DRN35_03785 [Thermoplasmata archaeon]|nr:MAG: hypothetical protein DRN28_01495 [Thermoplasmata archaeon]RLF70712.1 MAG: hypothetical protein DRN35_03785 [Thermoplasmata archaeon]RLF73830.1 MAG: hypothetical protein DRN55_02300 [Thermoplasmata archaeon]
MASESISQLIWFIATVLITTSVALLFINIIDDYGGVLTERASRLRGEVSADLEIINDPMAVPYDNTTGNITFYIKNTGSIRLSIVDLVVAANGVARGGSEISTRILGGGEWDPGKVLVTSFNVGNLTWGVDYHGWAQTSGITEGGKLAGTAWDTIEFQIAS